MPTRLVKVKIIEAHQGSVLIIMEIMMINVMMTETNKDYT